MDRSLRLVKAPEDVLGALGAAGIHTVRDLFSVGELRLAQLLPWLRVPEVRQLVCDISTHVAPRARTAAQMHARWIALNRSVPTGLRALDEALGGRGVPSDSVTELVGRAGVGKTQTCFTLTVQACMPITIGLVDADSDGSDSLSASSTAGTACYLDTERKFSAERVLQIAEARIKMIDPSLDSAAAKRVASTVVERIHVFTLSSCDEVLTLLTDTQALQAFIIENNTKIIVVDSIAAVARQDFAGGSGLIKRQQWLNKVASQLKYLAETFHMPVVVTNQVTTGGGGSGTGGRGDGEAMLRGTSKAAPADDVLASRKLQQRGAAAGQAQSSDARFREHMVSGLGGGGSHAPSLRPALGNTWAHGINTRLFLDVDAVAGSNHGTQRCIHITKSPTAPYLSVPFCLGVAGVMDLLSAPAAVAALGQTGDGLRP